MAAGGASGGLASVKINGQQVMLRGSLKVKMGNLKNTPIANQDGSVVFNSAPTVPMFSFNLSDYGGLSIQALQAITGATIIAALVNGKSYVLTGATYTEETELNTEDGSAPISYFGTSCNELVAGS